MKYKGARIQVLDLPGIIEGAADGRGRGRQVISTARTCNLILIVLDSAKPVTHKKIIESELNSFGIRINQEPPDVKIVKKENGGIGYQETVKQKQHEFLPRESAAETWLEQRLHSVFPIRHHELFLYNLSSNHRDG